MIFIGDDWAEDHHNVYLMDEAGRRLATRRLPEGLAGIRGLHERVAAHADVPGEAVIGIETDRGLWVEALAAAGYVERRPDPGDRRAQLVEATDEGRRVVRESHRRLVDAFAGALQDWAPADVAALAAALERLFAATVPSSR